MKRGKWDPEKQQRWSLTNMAPLGHLLAQSGKWPASAQVMISGFVSSGPGRALW